MTDLGVVDPIRAPASVTAFTTRIRGLPPYALAFLLVFAVRAAADLYQTALGFGDVVGPSSILGLLLGSLPDWFVLLIPVAVAWSIGRFGDVSGRLTRGAIAVGLSEVVLMAVRVAAPLVSGIAPESSSFLLSSFIRMVGTFLLAGGLIWMAHGLEALRTTDPSPRVRRAALLAVVIGLAAATLEFVGQAVQLVGLAASDVLEDVDRAILVSNAMAMAHVVILLAWVYLAWVLVRGAGDAGRPPQATRMGAAAGWFVTGWLGATVAALAVLPIASEAPGALAGGSAAVALLGLASIVAATCNVTALLAIVSALAGGLAAQGGRDAALALEADPGMLPAGEAPNG